MYAVNSDDAARKAQSADYTRVKQLDTYSVLVSILAISPSGIAGHNSIKAESPPKLSADPEWPLGSSKTAGDGALVMGRTACEEG